MASLNLFRFRWWFVLGWGWLSNEIGGYEILWSDVERLRQRIDNVNARADRSIDHALDL